MLQGTQQRFMAAVHPVNAALSASKSLLCASGTHQCTVTHPALLLQAWALLVPITLQLQQAFSLLPERYASPFSERKKKRLKKPKLLQNKARHSFKCKPLATNPPVLLSKPTRDVQPSPLPAEGPRMSFKAPASFPVAQHSLYLVLRSPMGCTLPAAAVSQHSELPVLFQDSALYNHPLCAACCFVLCPSCWPKPSELHPAAGPAVKQPLPILRTHRQVPMGEQHRAPGTRNTAKTFSYNSYCESRS